MENVKIKFLNDKATLPTKGSVDSAGWDLYAAESVIIEPYQTKKIGTGLSMELPSNTFMAIYPRSGLASKQGLRLANCVGVCDSDYRGEYCVVLYNDSSERRIVETGDRIAQAILQPYIPFEFETVEDLSDTERGEGGFGSTGV
jgi:dUTP pyrophosphatase